LPRDADSPQQLTDIDAQDQQDGDSACITNAYNHIGRFFVFESIAGELGPNRSLLVFEQESGRLTR
jgi:hypothetical protein